VSDTGTWLEGTCRREDAVEDVRLVELPCPPSIGTEKPEHVVHGEIGGRFVESNGRPVARPRPVLGAIATPALTTFRGR
jgi:hypothetical protein